MFSNIKAKMFIFHRHCEAILKDFVSEETPMEMGKK